MSQMVAQIDDDDNDFWFGFEQEYFIMDVETQLPLGFPMGGYPGPQGMYYCQSEGKILTEDHLLKNTLICVFKRELILKDKSRGCLWTMGISTI